MYIYERELVSIYIRIDDIKLDLDQGTDINNSFSHICVLQVLFNF